jgi:hypothetical protein
VYGVVWPLYGEEDDETLAESALAVLPAGTPERKTPLEQILVLLRECGIIRIKHHRDRFPIEFCEDCGVPLYADQNGELVHPEMPEGAPTGSEHFH